MSKAMTDISYFPGCSLASTARENNLSLISFCKRIGFHLIPLDDWNCCGSSSIYGLEPEAAFNLSSRNLSLAPPGRPLFIACPKCLLRLRQAKLKLERDERQRANYKKMWGKAFDEKLQILSVFDLLDQPDARQTLKACGADGLRNIRFVSYYGCMLNTPPGMDSGRKYHGQMEMLLSSLGATPIGWAYGSRCCGTFLSAVKPEITSAVVNEIMQGAYDSGADCVVTACAMCHMNLEMRHTLPAALPVLHFSEILALALGLPAEKKWFSRHLVDPVPFLKTFGFQPDSQRLQ